MIVCILSVLRYLKILIVVMGACCRKDLKSSQLDAKEENFEGELDAPIEEKMSRQAYNGDGNFSPEEQQFFEIARSIKTNSEYTDVTPYFNIIRIYFVRKALSSMNMNLTMGQKEVSPSLKNLKAKLIILDFCIHKKIYSVVGMQ
jgi:hypothetical protein